MRSNNTIKDSSTLVFFDFNKAYDSIPRDKLTHKLITIGKPCHIVELINKILKILALFIGNERILTHKGLIQGSVLSPILFNIFIDDLMMIFQANKIETRAYADGIICIWSNLPQAKKAIQKWSNGAYKIRWRLMKSNQAYYVYSRGKENKIHRK